MMNQENALSEVSAKRAYELMLSLAHERVSCTGAETEAAERLKAEAEAIGAVCGIETFMTASGRVTEAKLIVTEPYEKEYDVTGYIRSESTPDQGLELDLAYVEDALPANLVGAEGKAVLVNGRVGYAMYERLQKAKPAAIISFSGTIYDREDETDLDIRKLRETYSGEFGGNIMVNLRARDALEMVTLGASKIRLVVKSNRFDGMSRNVCAVIRGTELPDEIISYGAHYDSVDFSTGSYDNMSGSVIIMEMLRYFMANPPKRTVKFNWFGSEEQGLLGSKAWTAAHKEELENHVLMINVDVAGPILGSEKIFTMGAEPMKNYIEGMMNELGRAVKVEEHIYSSDSVPFADNGVPAVNFCRFASQGAGYMHDRRDDPALAFMSAKALGITLDNVLAFSKRVVNASVFPIAREISSSMKDSVDKYLFRKK